MEMSDKKKLDFYSFVKRKINEKEAEIRYRKYLQTLIQAKVSDFSVTQTMNFLYKVGNDKAGTSVIFIVGYFLPTDKKKLENANLYFVYYMDEIVEGPYNIVYFHNGVSAFDKRAINYLKELYKDLPMKYFINLTNFVTVDLPWIIRWDIEYGFSSVFKFLKKVISYVGSIEQLQAQPWFEKEFEDYIPDFRAHEKSIVMKMVKQSIFGKHLSDYCLADNGIPYILIALFLYFEEGDRIKTEGIFRKAAGASDVQKLITNIENGNFEAIFSVKDPLIIADLIKKLLKNLIDPLIPMHCYYELLKFEFVQEQNEINFFKNILQDMPQLNLKVLNFILKFFKKLKQYEESNLMTAKNIAICITPCILRNIDSPPSNSKSSVDLHKEIAKSFILVNCVRKMIENLNELFIEEKESPISSLENCLRRKTLVIQEMKQFAKMEEEKMSQSTKH